MAMTESRFPVNVHPSNGECAAAAGRARKASVDNTASALSREMAILSESVKETSREVKAVVDGQRKINESINILEERVKERLNIRAEGVQKPQSGRTGSPPADHPMDEMEYVDDDDSLERQGPPQITPATNRPSRKVTRKLN